MRKRFNIEKRSEERSRECFYSNLIQKLKNSDANIILMERDKTIGVLLNDLIKLHLKLGWLSHDNETLNIILETLKGHTQISEDELKEVRIKLLLKYASEGIEELRETIEEYIDDYANMNSTKNLIHRLLEELIDIEEKRESNLDVNCEEIEKIVDEIAKEMKRLRSQEETMKWEGRKTFIFKWFLPLTQIPSVSILSFVTYFYQNRNVAVTVIMTWIAITLATYSILKKYYRRYPRFTEEELGVMGYLRKFPLQ